MVPGERWPPIYDADTLAEAIEASFLKTQLEASFYDPDLERAGRYCQGDVLSLPRGVPVIDSDGAPQEIDEFEYWLGIGNTCDFDRAIENVAWTQIVPLLDLKDATSEQLKAFQAYRTSRQFYVPPWPGGDSSRVFAADFLRPVAIHKGAIGTHARVVARLSREGWILLHGCLIRFLARDDGRFAA